MKQPKGTMSKSLIDKIIIQAEIDSLLNDRREEFHNLEPYSLTPIREKFRFKHGVADLPPAYKETKPLESVFEADSCVYEEPVKQTESDELVFDGLYTNGDDKIQIEVPDVKGPCFISQHALEQLISKYGGSSYVEVENDRTVNYVCFAIDKRTLLKYCEIG